MKRLVGVMSIAIAISLTSTGWGQTQTTGSIGGTVLDSQGKPMSDATVTVRNMTRTLGESRISVKTDKNGNFAIANCALGNYLVLTRAELAGEASAKAAFPGNSVFTTVSLLPYLPAARVTLGFGRTTGVLTGRIKDAATGAPLTAALVVKSVGSADYWMAAGLPAEYRIVVPTGTGLSVAISAPGYQTWYYRGMSASATASTLSVRRGETKRVDVLLQPLAN
jgi:hypothetical protein